MPDPDRLLCGRVLKAYIFNSGMPPEVLAEYVSLSADEICGLVEGRKEATSNQLKDCEDVLDMPEGLLVHLYTGDYAERYEGVPVDTYPFLSPRDARIAYGELLRKYRKSKGWSGKRTARKLGLGKNPHEVYIIEFGRVRPFGAPPESCALVFGDPTFNMYKPLYEIAISRDNGVMDVLGDDGESGGIERLSKKPRRLPDGGCLRPSEKDLIDTFVDILGKDGGTVDMVAHMLGIHRTYIPKLIAEAIKSDPDLEYMLYSSVFPTSKVRKTSLFWGAHKDHILQELSRSGLPKNRDERERFARHIGYANWFSIERMFETRGLTLDGLFAEIGKTQEEHPKE